MSNFLDWQDEQHKEKRSRIDENGSGGSPRTGSGFEQGSGDQATSTVVPDPESSMRSVIEQLLDMFDGSVSYDEVNLSKRQENLMRGSEWQLRFYLKEDRWPTEEEKQGALTSIARGGTPLADMLSEQPWLST